MTKKAKRKRKRRRRKRRKRKMLDNILRSPEMKEDLICP
jgi:hypothetical protein